MRVLFSDADKGKWVRPCRCPRVLPALFLWSLLSIIPGIPGPSIRAGHCEAAVHDAAAGKADLSSSEVRCLIDKARKGGILKYELMLRNTGAGAAERLKVESRLLKENNVLLVSASPELLAPGRSREELTWEGTIGPGEEKHFFMDVLTVDYEYGSDGVRNTVTANWDGLTREFSCSTKVDRPEEINFDKKYPIRIMGRGFTYYNAFVTVYILVVLVILWYIPKVMNQRARERFESSLEISSFDDNVHSEHGWYLSAMRTSMFIGLLFVPGLLALAIDDVAPLVSYKKTTCAVLDKKAGYLTFRTGGVPLVAVRYDAGGKEIISARSLLSGFGDEGSGMEKLSLYEPGKSYDCWYDPDQPRDFVMRPSDINWSGYIIYIILVSPAIAIPAVYFYRRLRRPATSPKRT